MAANELAANDKGLLSRTTLTRPSLVAVAMTAPVSLLLLYLWSTPSSHHAMHGAGAATRPVVFLTAWMLMTAAMMLPSAMPLLAALDKMARSHARAHELPLLAALAYLAVWGVVGIAAWGISAAAGTYLLPRASTGAVSAIAGGSLVLAGTYGLSPLAGACLRACRLPFGFLARYWTGGSSARLQATRIGAAYGASCVGCCVPMIGIMFVVGMANMANIIALGIVMVVMKTSAIGNRVAQLLSIALIVIGVAVAFGWLPLGTPHHH